LYSIGAAHASVSVAGGWSQAGGHAALSSYYGLGADQILEYKVVTADGKLLITNNVTNQDIFWALRGGGAGTLGVVVEATLKVSSFPNSCLSECFTNMNLGIPSSQDFSLQLLA
jgi:FAD/FMN-containing dehydrogenase